MQSVFRKLDNLYREIVLGQFKHVLEDRQLRRALAAASESDAERLEREAWVSTMEHGGWT